MTKDELFSILDQHPERKLEDYRTFVETGTYGGDTAAMAAELFAVVHTIEAGPHFYTSRARLADFPNVSCHYNRSEVMLRMLEIPEPVIFYLDAHHCGIPGDDWSTNPLNLELEFIATRNFPDTIIIDDVQMFGGWHAPERDWREFTKDRCIATFGGLLKDQGRVVGRATMHSKFVMFLR